MVLKNSALMTLFFPTPPVIGSRKSLSEQRSSHSYPFRMCFRHRADAGYFLQPIRFRIGSVYADYICSRCRTYGYVLPIPSSLFGVFPKNLRVFKNKLLYSPLHYIILLLLVNLHLIHENHTPLVQKIYEKKRCLEKCKKINSLRNETNVQYYQH